MPQIPQDQSFESTLALLRDPYGFIAQRCRRYRSDLFETRLMLQKTICMSGPDAAELFYDPDRFMRRHATPGRVQKALFGQGGVQGLDDELHRHRKQMFMSLMTPERIGSLVELAAHWWEAYARKWAEMGEVVLYGELQELLTRAVCAWAGVPLEEAEVRRRARDLTELFDYAGSVGPRHWQSRMARKRADRWMEDIVTRIRDGRVEAPEGTAAHVIAWHRDATGELPTPHIAAVEVLNALRPTVAVAVYITFIAHALHHHPEWRRKIASGEDGSDELFVQEVRRFYPFFPSVMARVRYDFDWNGYLFPQGRRVVLDLHGTNRDARSWEAPDAFGPERFAGWEGNPFTFVPQGGGDHHVNHRCAGEWVTIELMKGAAGFLTRHLTYDIPEQDLRIEETRLPALPRSRVLLRNVSMEE